MEERVLLEELCEVRKTVEELRLQYSCLSYYNEKCLGWASILETLKRIMSG